MKRSKRHRVKQEAPETSTSRAALEKEHDLAYYIHDRVELMHQVFSVLKAKELKAMAPECVRHISVNDLQELCMEELLGISSKRLCAILDGASTPSDTESSSESERLETISLDSISSDDEILSQVTRKHKKHKHRSRSRGKRCKERSGEERQQERSRRAGLTVLELLELQARARAIRAQLQQEHAAAAAAGGAAVAGGSTDDEVEIKEEAAEVVEISSEEEKPAVRQLAERVAAVDKDTGSGNISNPKTVTKKVNDLVITVPQTKSSRKIKLKRKAVSKDEKPVENVATTIVADVEESNKGNDCTKTSKRSPISSTITSANGNLDASHEKPVNKTAVVLNKDAKDKGKSKDRKKKRRKDKIKDKEASDHDEITLQLSDTEKMDLLEDLEEKKFQKPCETEDSSSDSDSEESSSNENDSGEDSKTGNAQVNVIKSSGDRLSTRSESSCLNEKEAEKHECGDEATSVEKAAVAEQKVKKHECGDEATSVEKAAVAEQKVKENICTQGNKLEADVSEKENEIEKGQKENDKPHSCVDNKTLVEVTEVVQNTIDLEYQDKVSSDRNALEITCINDIPLQTEVDPTHDIEGNVQYIEVKQADKTNDCGEPKEVKNKALDDKAIIKEFGKVISITDNNLHSEDTEREEPTIITVSNKEIIDKISAEESTANSSNKKDVREKSDGELSDRDSSEVEEVKASEFKPDVVCISDDEEKRGKKKKKKDKKCKKDKKSKKKKDFRESADQNFYTETNNHNSNKQHTSQSDEILNKDVAQKDPSLECDIGDNNANCQVNEGVSIPEAATVGLNEIKTEESANVQSKALNPDTDTDYDVYEILELSDDSSCYEVEEISISKEPTAEEIEALSAKIDEIEIDRSINSDVLDGTDIKHLEHVSWKDRYLESTKVKKVLSTANILNAMRKKNLVLKKKIKDAKEESKLNENPVNEDEHIITPSDTLEEGSIEQYNTLEASTKYVDPVRDVTDKEIENGTGDKENGTGNKDAPDKDKVTKEMKKDAKQLLKMYKMLMKYNDMTRKKESSKKKKKKKSKDKDKDKVRQESSVT